VLAVLLAALTGCSGSGASNQDGFVGSTTAITQVPATERKPAPVVSGPALDGEETVSTAAYAGRVVVLNVWGSWCSPCRVEAKDLQAASVQTQGRAQFLGLNTKDSDPAQAQAFVRSFGITYPSIFDPDGSEVVKFTGLLPPNGIPSTLVIDRDGRVAARIVGTISEATLVDLIDDVANGR